MKIFYLIVLVLCFSFFARSQEKSIINIGVNFPLFFTQDKLGYDDTRITSKPGFYIEKPFPIDLFEIKYLYIIPGVEYFNTHENVYHARSSNEFNRDVDHKSISGYFKLIKKLEIKNTKIYFGGFSGIQLYSSSKGADEWKVYYLNGQSYGGYETIENKGKSDFYNLIYYGFLVGIEKDFMKMAWLTPGLEFKLLPNFGMVYKDNCKSSFGGFELTLNLGIQNHKK
jgi:hypothetical protein